MRYTTYTNVSLLSDLLLVGIINYCFQPWVKKKLSALKNILYLTALISSLELSTRDLILLYFYVYR